MYYGVESTSGGVCKARATLRAGGHAASCRVGQITLAAPHLGHSIVMQPGRDGSPTATLTRGPSTTARRFRHWLPGKSGCGATQRISDVTG